MLCITGYYYDRLLGDVRNSIQFHAHNKPTPRELDLEPPLSQGARREQPRRRRHFRRVSLRDHGLDSFHVVDNGSGISPDNFEVLCLKHHTSKLTDFPDLLLLMNFGFRGEALSSLCALGELSVETRTKNETVVSLLTFDHSGLLVTRESSARQVVTTVTVRKLFANLPVWSKEFTRNIRKEYGKLISLMTFPNMIGDALGRNEMKRILGHLAGLRSPWNCPHGRPTMRYLVDLTAVRRRIERGRW